PFPYTTLFRSESWLGSCARSLKEALTRQPGVHLDEVNEDLFFPKHQAKWLRSIDRLLRGAYKRELERQVLDRVSAFGPDFVITYKGFPLDARVLARLRGMGACLALASACSRLAALSRTLTMRWFQQRCSCAWGKTLASPPQIPRCPSPMTKRGQQRPRALRSRRVAD